MKILHTSDWHLGKQLNNHSRHIEQIEVLDEICEIATAEDVKAVIVAGDIFDTYNPPTESAELLYKTLKRLSDNGKRLVLAIAGNHDSPDRIEAPDPLARECGILFAGYPYSVISPFELESGLKVNESEEGYVSVSIPGEEAPLRILLTSYANEFRLKRYLGAEDPEEELRMTLERRWTDLADRYCNTQGINILVSHLLVMKKGGQMPEEPEEEKPILHIGGAQIVYAENIPSQIQYTALGHLHRKQNVVSSGAPVVYSGSPLSYSFSEAGQTKAVIIADILPGRIASVKEVNLTKGRQLLVKRAEKVEEAVEWLKNNQNTLVELTMATDTYLTAAERKKLYSAHDGIVSFIPDVRNKNFNENNGKMNIDLDKSMEALFKDYFIEAKGQEPSESIMQLFKEVLSEEDSQ